MTPEEINEVAQQISRKRLADHNMRFDDGLFFKLFEWPITSEEIAMSVCRSEEYWLRMAKGL